jgi:hypothetical protein
MHAQGKSFWPRDIKRKIMSSHSGNVEKGNRVGVAHDHCRPFALGFVFAVVFAFDFAFGAKSI